MQNRRHFIAKLAAASGGTLAASHLVHAKADAPAAQVDRRTLGHSGVSVPILGLGLGSVFTNPYGGKPEEAQAILERALSLGIDYWDTGRMYGLSETTVGPTLEKHRSKVFMVSKSGDRSYDGYMRDLETSLRNLRTDYLDLHHLHSFDPREDTDLDAIERGAIRAAREAKEQGIIRHFGMTGHSGPDILMAGIRRWQPDVVMTTFPADRPYDGRYETELLPLAQEKGVGVIAMKTIRWARNADLPGPQLVRYALSLPGIAGAIVGLDTIAHLEENAAMATHFTPLPADQLASLHQHVKAAIADIGPAPWQRPHYRDASPA